MTTPNRSWRVSDAEATEADGASACVHAEPQRGQRPQRGCHVYSTADATATDGRRLHRAHGPHAGQQPDSDHHSR